MSTNAASTFADTLTLLRGGRTERGCIALACDTSGTAAAAIAAPPATFEAEVKAPRNMVSGAEFHTQAHLPLSTGGKQAISHCKRADTH